MIDALNKTDDLGKTGKVRSGITYHKWTEQIVRRVKPVFHQADLFVPEGTFSFSIIEKGSCFERQNSHSEKRGFRKVSFFVPLGYTVKHCTTSMKN